MAQLVKKENLTISIREYTDGQGNPKKVWKTIGELITWRGDDQQEYQSFEMWGPTGSTQGKVFEQKDNNQQQPAPQQGGYTQQPQQGGFAPQGQQQPAPQQGGFNPQGGYGQQ